MPDYFVTWGIEISDVDSPREAAREARDAQTRDGTWAVVFDVTDDRGTTVQIDLLDDEEQEG